ncbi:MAG: Ribosomal protein [Gammaproteobacteria bacterium]|jgi:large subunit ribosomal protein L23|nr:Ribosomal protein [Gammaproteobacteria bacterium]
MKAKADYTNIILAPVVTEKSHRAADKNKTIVFKVLPKASKPQICEAVEKLFDVKVSAIRTVKTKGKTKNFSGRQGQRSDAKKAYVTLKDGFDINFAGQ